MNHGHRYRICEQHIDGKDCEQFVRTREAGTLEGTACTFLAL